MRFFYLAHGVMSYVCLKDLVEKNHIPGFVAIHKDYEKTKLMHSFFEPIENLCRSSSIELIKTQSISELKEIIKDYDVGICVGFMEIIKKEVFEAPKYGILNLHCGKLPEYRGRAPISRTIMNGEENLVISIHKMDEGVDSGDILNETKISIEDNDDVNSLYNKCSKKSAISLIESINKIESGNPAFIKQKIHENSKANKKISDEERRINWNDDILKIKNLIRALTPPYPGAFSTINNKAYLFISSEIYSSKRKDNLKNGEITDFIDNSMLLNCSNGVLKINKISDKISSTVNTKETFKIGDIFE